MDSIQVNGFKKNILFTKVWRFLLALFIFIAVCGVAYHKFIWKPSTISEARDAAELWSFLPGAPEENIRPWMNILSEISTNERFFDQYSHVEELFDQAYTRVKNSVKSTDDKAMTVSRFFPLLAGTAGGMLSCHYNFKDRYLCKKMVEIAPAVTFIGNIFETAPDKNSLYPRIALRKLSNSQELNIVLRFLEDYEKKITTSNTDGVN